MTATSENVLSIKVPDPSMFHSCLWQEILIKPVEFLNTLLVYTNA